MSSPVIPGAINEKEAVVKMCERGIGLYRVLPLSQDMDTTGQAAAEADEACLQVR